MKDIKEVEIYIPQNIKKRKEMVSGYSKSELKKTTGLFIFFLVVALINFLFTKNEIIFMFTLMGAAIISVFVFTKVESNMSFYDMLRFIYRFYNLQQEFIYKYNNRWFK